MGIDREYRDSLKQEERAKRKPHPKVLEEDTKKEIDDKENKIENTEENDVYKQLSRKNHFLNIQELSTLKNICKEENIDASGKKSVVTKRLKEYYKVKMLRAAGVLPPSPNSVYDFLVVMDFEATCEQSNLPNYPHEIIEFPAVIIDINKWEIVDRWRKYVKPKLNPTLSPFCTKLTGITQDMVDSADDFLTVMNQFNEWMISKGLGSEHTFAVATDGPFDIARFLLLSCQQNELTVPEWASRWINVKKVFLNFYKIDKRYDKVRGLQDMLSRMNLEFEGNPHCGLDDASNIARVVIRLLKDGANFRVNEKLEIPGNKNRRLQHVAPVTREEANSWLKSCNSKCSKSSAIIQS